MTSSSRVDRSQQRARLALLRELVRPGPPARVLKHAEAAVTTAALSDGLIERAPGKLQTYVVTSAGRAWLRRQLASDDPFLSQHRELRRVVPPAKGKQPAESPLLVNDAESPLAWLRRRKDRAGAPLIDDKQFEAGERLRRDYTFAALGPRVTANWSNLAPTERQQRGGAPASAMRDDVIAAKSRVARAIAAAGPELGRMLMDVCCLLKGIEVAETGQGLPQRSGKVVLQLALTVLARHYGLIAPPAAPRDAAHILQWGEADYRPRLTPSS